MSDIIDVNVKLASSDYEEVFENLSDKELDRISRRATVAAATIIKNQTKANLRKHTSRAKSTYTNAKRGWNLKRSKKTGQVVGVASLEEGIKMKYHKNEAYTKVNIMGDFRLKWMENSTRQRFAKIKSGARADRGKMPHWRFFQNAISEKSNEAYERMVSIIETNLDAIIAVRGK